MQEELNILKDSRSDWGGPWTETKLETFTKYVASYLRIMKRNPFWQTIYFDGFAGSGERKRENLSSLYQQLQITSQEEHVYKGSAERILKLNGENTFDYYYFIDTNEDSLCRLEKKLKNIQELSDRKIVYKHGDCNNYIAELAKALRTGKYAALVFLDPFGMQINWDSITELKGTRSDLWILVPTGMIVNRLLDKNAELTHLNKLQSFLGLPEDEIRAHFYNQRKLNTLFGEEIVTNKIKRPIEQIAHLYIKQLKRIWDHVTENPLVLTNSKGVPLFHFVFASNNRNAVKIAGQIIKSR